MKKICDHPQLLHREMKTVQNVDFKSLTEAKTMEELISQSGKLVFLFSLLKNIKANGHRILIFSQSAQMLDIVESIFFFFLIFFLAILNKKKYSLLRIDGSVLNPKERQRRINLFNSDPSIFCFLLTTNVGGLGLNLTSADRAVICMCFT